ncbi:ABC transporter substrate-binding protein [Methanosarcina sp. Mfa9]|uniref:ABC transporter substrate-binding protein n=1 Tax=Methanosarcina sp. Mfa9 TaxID=3439063 RepID=UPI003F87A8E8
MLMGDNLATGKKEHVLGTLKKFLPMFLLLLVTVFMIISAGCVSKEDSAATEKNKIITDMRGEKVEIPQDPQRVAVIDKALTIQTMIALDVDEKIVATGGVINPNSKNPTKNRDTLYLRPGLINVTNCGYAYYGGFNYETLISAQPDVVIWHMLQNTENNEETLELINRLNEAGIPVVAVVDAGCANASSSIETQFEGIKLIGEIFNKQNEAQELVDYIKQSTDMVYERTKNIPESEKESTMIVGLSKDGSGYVWGVDYGSAVFSTEVVHIKNVYEEQNTQILSKEQIISLNPGKIILVDGPLALSDPDEIYAAEGFESWQVMDAIKNKQVTSVGLFPWWGDFGLEFPTAILIEAKSAYPEEFADIEINEWLTEYHKNLYGLNDTQCRELAAQQYLEWIYVKDF